MRDGFRPGRGRRAKPGISNAVVLGVFALAVAVLIVGGGLALLLLGGKGNPLVPGFALNLPNAKVNEDSYDALRSGATLAEVEGVLGVPGRPPTAADFDAVCGDERQRFTNPFSRERPAWEENARRGLMRAWANGPVRILLTFSGPPEAGGRLVAKVMREADGSVNCQSGGPFGPPAGPNPKPGGNAPRPNGDADWARFVGTWEVDGDPRFRIRFGADREMGDIFVVDGRPAREKVYTVRDVQTVNGRITPQLVQGAVNGADVVTPALGTFWFANGKLHRDPGHGQPVQTLRRVG